MKDPYKVLGVPYNATDDEIKSAYKELAKKYHPDNYSSGPLFDIANEKTQEINAAYDEIMNTRRGSGSNSSGGDHAGADSNCSGHGCGSNLGDIRSLINRNRLIEAEELLDGIPASARSAEWYFLKGTLFFSRGWLEDATSCWNTAVQMDPNNIEYRSALNRVMWQRQGNYGGGPRGQYRTPQGNSECNACDICTGLMCADCCCHCMGGNGCC